jgi:hypothetical protein
VTIWLIDESAIVRLHPSADDAAPLVTLRGRSAPPSIPSTVLSIPGPAEPLTPLPAPEPMPPIEPLEPLVPNDPPEPSII